MVKPGNWHIELDDRASADPHAQMGGVVQLETGEVLRGGLYGRKWRIDRVERKHGRARRPGTSSALNRGNTERTVCVPTRRSLAA